MAPNRKVLGVDVKAHSLLKTLFITALNNSVTLSVRKFHSGCKDEIIRFHYSLSDGRRTDVGRPSDGRPTVVRSLSDRRPAAVRRPSNGRPKNIRPKKIPPKTFSPKNVPRKIGGFAIRTP